MDVSSPSKIASLRGDRSRADFAALLGVTALTVYRWELPPDAPQARRPRGKVLARLLAFAKAQAVPQLEPTSSLHGLHSAPSPQSGPDEDELIAFESARARIDQCQFAQAEQELLTLLAGSRLRSHAARVLAALTVARIQLLARHDTKSAFATLSGLALDLARVPVRVQLEYHLTAAFLFAHSDAQLFNPGKTHHHVALAQQLIPRASGDQRFFLWYAQFTAATSLYDFALLARAMESLPAMQELAASPLYRCLAVEAVTLSSISSTSTAEAARRLDEFKQLAVERSLPLQHLRALIWRAEISVEEAAPPPRTLALLDEGERILQRHRIADGIHVMLMRRNRGETLMRLGRLQDAEAVLLDAARVARDIAYTPIRIFTTLARLYALTNQADALADLAQKALASNDAQGELTRTFGQLLVVLSDLFRGDASANWCERTVSLLDELGRLGAWPMALRHLALLAIGMAAVRGTAREAEKLMAAAERIVELSASATATATYRRHRAAVLMRRGKLTEARQALEASLATFTASEDVAEAALVRRSLANVTALEHAEHAAQELERTEAELRLLGLPVPALLQQDAQQHLEEPSAEPPIAAPIVQIERAVVPLQRLATRGLGEALLQKELVNITAELFPGRTVRLQEVDVEGRGTELARRAGDDDVHVTWCELSDGLGRRMSLGVSGSLHAAQRALLEVVASTAGLAFEVAALRALPLSRRQREPIATAAEPHVADDFVAASPAMRHLKTELGRLSSSRATIIITGESGTGKEVVARAIHQLSRRADHPYVTFNSATVPRELFEGQLFGHKKGAFTGAHSDQLGVIRSAEGGTLFLDEIGELPLDVQPKLLRFLENGEVLPLGGREPVRVDVRIIAATHRDLRALVRDGKFREDLYYRLQVVPVEVAPLRERPEDILALARNFIQRMTPPDTLAPILTADGEARLLAHAWPGNVRELRNVIERCMAFEPLPRSLGAAEIRL